MTTLTPNYSLTTYAATGGDETSTFLNFRTALAGVSNSNMTKIDTALADLLKLDGTRSMTGSLRTSSYLRALSTGNGEITIGDDANGNLKIGKPTRTASGTPYIDFYNIANPSSYAGARIISNGGSNSSHFQGNLEFHATKISVNGSSDVLSSKMGVNLFIDGGDEVITNTTDDKVTTEVPYACLINRWTMASTDGTTGSISIIIEKTSYANFPSIGWSTLATISISSSTKNQGTVSWSLAEGDMLRARVSGTPSEIKKLSISLKGDKR